MACVGARKIRSRTKTRVPRHNGVLFNENLNRPTEIFRDEDKYNVFTEIPAYVSHREHEQIDATKVIEVLLRRFTSSGKHSRMNDVTAPWDWCASPNYFVMLLHKALKLF